MTNYNERLDEILDKFGWTCVANGGDGYGLQNEDISEAKQALISLIKELVAEARPLYYVSPDKSEYQDGFNTCIRLYEQNLLKVLESK